MSEEDRNLSPELERAAEEIRTENADDAVVEAAAARVWARLAGEARPLAVEHLRTCADFQSLLPDYRAGRLPEARVLLIEDHLHECVACRKAAEGPAKVVGFPAPRRKPVTSRPAFRWGAAAAVAVAAGLGAWSAIERFGATNVRPTVLAANGALYRVAANGLEPFAAGAELPNDAEIRTAKDSDAVVQLRDGSRMEVRERSAFSISDGGADLTVKLARGSVIVEAAKRRSGHLYVATADCRVAVTGTVFSVSAGMKGSRVSVVEGQVKVAQGGGEKTLLPGEQTTTSATIEALTVPEDIAWSRNVQKHLALLGDLAKLKKSLDQVRMPQLRYSSRLTPNLPENIAVFASIPNLGSYLADTQSVFRQKLAESPALREWWKERAQHTEVILDKLRAASDYLGDEILLVAPAGAHGIEAPVFLAETRRPGLAEFLAKAGVPVKVAAGLADLPAAGGNALYVVTQAGITAVSLQPEAVRQVLGGPGKGFPSTPLGQRVNDAYRNGAGLLLCADLERFGVKGGVRYFMAEQKDLSDRTEMRAELGFAGALPGVASWLAAPAPIGALDYVSPEAIMVSAFAVANPAKTLDDVFGKGIGPIPPASEIGFDVKELAAALGGEFSLSVDGPALPTPSWKMVAEVYHPDRLQNALRKMVETVNAKHAKPLLRTGQETVNGRAYFLIAGADENPLTEAHYTFADGYLIMAANRALVDRALQYHATGYTLGRSPQFMALVPHDRHANFSGLLYYNVAATVKQYSGLLSGFMNDQQKEMVRQLGESKPTLVAAFGEGERIVVTGSGSMFGVSMSNLLAGNVFGAGVMPFGGKMGGTRRQGAAYR